MKKIPSRSVLPRGLADKLVALLKAARYAELETKAGLAVTHYPDSGPAWKVYWVALSRQGKEALPALQRALKLAPGDRELLVAYGDARRELGFLNEAADSYRRALTVDPDRAEVLGRLGGVLQAMGEGAQALSSCRRVIELAPQSARAHSNLGLVLQEFGRRDEAIASYRRALELDPSFSEAFSNLLFCLSLDGVVDARTLFAEHRRFGEHFEAPLRAEWPVHGNTREAGRCLQVGFVSGDLRNHAVAFFLEPLLEHLSGDTQLSLHAYSNHAHEDAVSERLQAYFKHWHRVSGLSDEALAHKIRSDGIDILIDLSGHTAHNRLLTFARKPAPVQVTWLGYPGTTGLQAMDYFLADRYWLPPGQFDTQFTEKIAYMPAVSPFSAPADAPEVNALPARGNGYLTFGSFNRANKLSRAVIASWSSLLRALPQARMLLGGLPEEGKHETLVEWFVQEGVDPDRLSFHTRCGIVSYLELYHRVDICLDTFPYNGGTTTYLALWMGVPTLTLAGSTAASRSGAAILGALGLDDFVAHDAEDFVAKGAAWAGRLDELAILRSQLRKRFACSEKGQPVLLAESLSQRLRQMWQRWCDGLPAESFVVTIDGGDDVASVSLAAGRQAVSDDTPVRAPVQGGTERTLAQALPLTERDALIALFNTGRYAELEIKASVLAVLHPDSGFVWKALGAALRIQGKDALFALQAAARLLPAEYEVHVNLADALAEQRRYDEAVVSYRQALAIRSDDAEVLNRLADALRQQGLFAEAASSCRRALAISPAYASALNNLACALASLGQCEAAVASFRDALAIDPQLLEAHNNLGIALRELGRHDEAVACFRQAITLQPDLAEPYNNLGNVLRDLGQNDEAAASFLRALEINPDFAEAHNNLGVALVGLGRLDEALARYRRALEIRPDFAEAYINQGNALLADRQPEQALASFQRASQIKPGLFEAPLGMGNVLKEVGRLGEALACYRQALAIAPRSAKAYFNMGLITQELGRRDEAIASYRRALELDPSFSEAFSNLLFFLSLDGVVDAQTLFAEHRRFGEHFEAPLRAEWPVHGNTREAGRCLQVGFVSGDLYNHAVSFFLEPVLTHLSNDAQLSLHAYSSYAYEDAVSLRLQAYFKHWHRVSGLSDEALAQKIRSDGIDILIDLSGHTAHNRLLTFARKPAPLQVTWLGYPGTTGLQAMDYFLADRYWLPPGQFDTQFTEKIACMPAVSPFSAPADAPEVNALPARGNGYLTFGSFNRANKLSRAVIASWSSLLRALPQARMLLGGLPEEDKHETLVEWFVQEGVDPDRLSFHTRCGMVSYLELYHRVDICLDTFPYNGGTTTYFALWMGVPTLTLAGSTAASRSGAAILGALGLDDFVAHDAEDFVAKGAAWAGRLDELAILRSQLRKRFACSEKGQPVLLAESLSQTLRQMWRRWCAGLPPESFSVRAAPSTCTATGNGAVAMTAVTPVYVTQPVLPPLEDFIPYLEKIWASKRLTNGGQFHQQLEQALCDYLGVKHLSLFANGTLALVTALQALRIKGEVITTPYSFVATSHALLWNGIKPVFVDIDPQTFNLDPARIEAAITPETTAILPVHCYGHPCDVEAIQAIADNYNLKVIYDAAHAFGVRDAQGSVLRYGDLSVLSFHATKVFNTFEGGAIVCPDARTKQHIDHLKNFGFVDDVTVVAAGINGKMSEINAAFGLLQLQGIDAALNARRAIDMRYRQALAGAAGIECLGGKHETAANYSYFPILVGPQCPLSRDALFDKLKEHGVFARRYFYPLISEFSMYRGIPSAVQANLPVARRVAEQVICLPIYPDLSEAQLDLIVRIVRGEI